MNRRGFLGSILAACAAPAIVRADSLMRIVPMETEVLVPMTELLVATAQSGNRLLNMDEITRMALAVAHDKFQFIKAINVEARSHYDEYSDQTQISARILIPGTPKRKTEEVGDTIRVRLPDRYEPYCA